MWPAGSCAPLFFSHVAVACGDVYTVSRGPDDGFARDLIGSCTASPRPALSTQRESNVCLNPPLPPLAATVRESLLGVLLSGANV